MLTAEIARTSLSRMPRGRYLCIGAHQPVASRAHGFDRGVAIDLGELPAQIADIDVEDVRPGVVVIAPDRVEDLRAREDPVRMPHQVRQQLELAGGQIHLATSANDLAGPEVEAESSHHERRRVGLPWLAQLRSDPRKELCEGERLAEVVAGAEVETRDHVLRL